MRIRTGDSKQFDEDDFTINIKNDEITIKCSAPTSKYTKILVEIPVKAFLHIEANGTLECSNLHSDFIDLIACGDLITKNLRSNEITLKSKHGNINCNGLTLAQNINISTFKNGVCGFISLYVNKL